MGGSDGNLLNSDLFLVDLLNESVMYKPTNFEFSTGMGHLIFREKEKELHHIGGFNSFGVNYKLKLGTENWEVLPSCHSNVTN